MRHLHLHFRSLIHDIWFWDVFIILMFLTFLVIAILHHPENFSKISPYDVFK